MHILCTCILRKGIKMIFVKCQTFPSRHRNRALSYLNTVQVKLIAQPRFLLFKKHVYVVVWMTVRLNARNVVTISLTKRYKVVRMDGFGLCKVKRKHSNIL